MISVSAPRYLNQLALILCLALMTSGCSGLESKWPATTESDHYTALLQSALVTDDTYEWKTLSSTLIVRALYYSPQISQAAQTRFTGDPTFTSETKTWPDQPKGKGLRGSPVIILMGLYAPDLTEKDVTKLGRFRPNLITFDGRLMEPIEIKRFGRDKAFIKDHFPVFNPWEEVYLVKFSDPGSGQTAGQLDFKIHWPGGVQSLTLPVR